MEEVIILALVLVVLFAVAIAVRQRMAVRRLRTTYGPEYHRLEERGETPRAIRRALREREDRVSQMRLIPLTLEQKQRMTESWRGIQAQFVDAPDAAVDNAERMLEEVMRARGYVASDRETRFSDLSVHHAHVLQDYREACGIADLHRERRASTEDLRRAMVLYRSMLEDLLQR